MLCLVGKDTEHASVSKLPAAKGMFRHDNDSTSCATLRFSIASFQK